MAPWLLHPLTAICIPLLGAVAIVATGRWPNVREMATMVTALALFGVVACMVPGAMATDFSASAWEAGRALSFPVLDTGHVRADPQGGEAIPVFLSLALRVEPLGMIYALIAATLWPLNSLYSVGYMRGNSEKHQTRFYLCFALALSSVMGVAFADNLFTLFVFYEALTLSTFPLVSHKGTPEAVRSSRTYLGILMSTSIGFLLAAIVGVWVHTGTVDFSPGGIAALDAVNPTTVGLLFALSIFGIGKCAIMPMHRWLPAAMVAPTPVSALLHAVAVVKAGVFAVLKVTVYTFGVERLAAVGTGDWIMYVAGFTIVCASFIALFQDNLKRRLAYSTISQLSYIVLGATMFNVYALVGAGLHVAAHAFGKITLFFAAGSIYTAAHKTEVSQLDGIGRRMPWTMGAFTVGTLSMIGLPLTAGIISKFYLLQGGIDLRSGFVITILVLSTLLNAGYFLPIVYRAFFRAEQHEEGDGDDHGHHHEHGEAPWPIVVALTCTAAAAVAFFFWPDLFEDLMWTVWHGATGGAR